MRFSKKKKIAGFASGYSVKTVENYWLSGINLTHNLVDQQAKNHQNATEKKNEIHQKYTLYDYLQNSIKITKTAENFSTWISNVISFKFEQWILETQSRITTVNRSFTKNAFDKEISCKNNIRN